jgi:L-alanine-DL-glutamate epimerase-like enolase superfamily enzyme
MKITRIDIYQISYKLLEEKYAWAKGHFVSSFLSTIVKISTDEGITGYGEVCPLGSTYMEAYSEGIPKGIEKLGAALIGKDPCQINIINSLIDSILKGHNYIKSPIDIACWDIFGKFVGLPVCALLGGELMSSYSLYRAISQGSPEEMADRVARFREEGYSRFQLKVGGNPDDDIKRIKAVLEVVQSENIVIADANTGWLSHEALKVVNAFKEAFIHIEQPCVSLEECLIIRKHTNLPFILDEIITGVPSLLRAHRYQAMDIVNLKISRIRGLTKAKQLHDLCQSLGIGMTIEDGVEILQLLQ